MPLDIHARYSGRTAYFAAPTDALFTDNASRYSSWGEQLMAVASASAVVPIAAVNKKLYTSVSTLHIMLF
jgi:hypothetical protein